MRTVRRATLVAWLSGVVLVGLSAPAWADEPGSSNPFVEQTLAQVRVASAAGAAIPLATASAPAATVCPAVATSCPPTATKCPPAATQCPAKSTSCPPTSTACPAAATTCPPSATKCPATTTQCPPTATQCPPVATQCPAVATQCPPTPNGATLYASSCSCHGPLAQSSKRGASAGAIQSAINSNRGGMGFLSGLTPAQVAAIAAALK
ncbi:MAG: hypothetical protein NTV86_16890 [Planctomycetota bacterium]|nr:hypothetical protein [Planctomycetota bacterium]